VLLSVLEQTFALGSKPWRNLSRRFSVARNPMRYESTRVGYQAAQNRDLP
jgi:hypothetical protein